MIPRALPSLITAPAPCRYSVTLHSHLDFHKSCCKGLLIPEQRSLNQLIIKKNVNDLVPLPMLVTRKDWTQLVQSLVDSGVTWTAQVQMDTPVSNLNYVNNGSPNQSHYSQSPLREVSTGGGGDPGGGNCNSAPGGALFGARAPCPSGNSCPGCARCLAPNTPNTPTSIPDIILTDFSSTGCGGCGSCALSVGDALSKELLCSGATDGLFADEDGLRDGLDPIDLDGLQMLTDPDMNVVSDPSTEDAFRLDRL